MLIDTFVNAVFVHDDKLLLTFNFKDGTRTITLTDAKIAVEKNTGSNLDCSAAPKKRRLRPPLFWCRRVRTGGEIPGSDLSAAGGG